MPGSPCCSSRTMSNSRWRRIASSLSCSVCRAPSRRSDRASTAPRYRASRRGDLAASGLQIASERKSWSRRSLARAASAMAVSTGFFSGPVVKTAESATTTLVAPCTRENASTTPKLRRFMHPTRPSVVH